MAARAGDSIFVRCVVRAVRPALPGYFSHAVLFRLSGFNQLFIAFVLGVIISVPRPKLLIMDPDPLMETREFPVRILETIQLQI